MPHFVYIIYSPSGNRFYIGETFNVAERLNQHNSGYYSGSSTKAFSDWEVYFTLECNSRSQALQIERYIKQMRNRSFYQKLKENEELQNFLLNKFS